jgi:hypothetical protein
MPGQLKVNINGVWKDLPSVGPPGPIGPAGADSMVAGPTGPTGPTGPIVPGGAAGEVLTKASATDGDVLWAPPTLIRHGHASASTSGFGDTIFNFSSPFPAGLTISVTITPHQAASDVFWFPVITNISDSAVQFFACAPTGYPFAGGHPPGQAGVWTIASAGIVFDYIAIGV